MTTVTATEPRANLFRLMDQAAQTHRPITISRRQHGAVLASADDWQAIQETLYLLSVPRMRESIKTGMALLIEDGSRKLDWCE